MPPTETTRFANNSAGSVPPWLKTRKRLAILSDIHIGIHDEGATRCLIEVFEAAGVDGIIANGDIHDCGPVSRHPSKRARARVDLGQLREEAASGRWIVDWFQTRPTIYGTGNHEAWVDAVALEQGLEGTLTVASALGLPVGPEFVVLDNGYQIRIGSLVIEHGNHTLGQSRGGANLAATILRRYPNQTTIVGHFHHADFAVATTPDHRGIPRSHAAHCLGHLSDPTQHTDYAGRSPNWQQGGAIIELWQDGSSPRFTIRPIEIHRDRRNRPIVEWGGKIFR